MREKVLSGTSRPDAFGRGVHVVCGILMLMFGLAMAGVSLYVSKYYVEGLIVGGAVCAWAIRIIWRAARPANLIDVR